MNIPFFSLNGSLVTAALVLAGALTLPESAMADNHHKKHHDDHHEHHGDNDRREHGGGHETYHHSSSRSSFTLNLSNGYAGRGYYYGPSRSSYYHRGPEVRFYAHREEVPREYYVHESYAGSSVGASVQSALAGRGYYHGEIDGDIGPRSRHSIARYQEDHGLNPTGNITPGLLRSLNL